MFLFSFQPWCVRTWVLMGLCLGAASAVLGQTVPSSPTMPASAASTSSATTLRQALDAAWALSLPSRTTPAKLAELQARERATQSLTAGAGSITLAHRTDAFTANAGLREYELELAWPLWNRSVRASTQRHIAAEHAALEQQNTLARLTLAGELRELAAALMLARLERDLAARKHAETTQLAQDVQRRVRAGELARVDDLLAQASTQQADIALAQAESGLLKLQSQWRMLTGLSSAPMLLETADAAMPGADPSSHSKHPSLQATQAQLAASQAKLVLAQTDQRDPMELGLGITQERAAFGAGADTSLRFALRIPLGGEQRNAPRIAAARADLDAAQAQADTATRQIQADTAIALVALAVARRSETLAAVRARLSFEVHALITRSYQLGEGDLPTRLRAENDKFDADQSLARTRIEVQRAISQLNQALGLLP